jgi:cysteine synthase A
MMPTTLLQLDTHLFAKAEYENPTGSVKDRAAACILQEAEVQGLLLPGGTVIEPTSGNMDISLAAIAAKQGYRCIIVMPDSMSPERRQIIQTYGAEVMLTPGDLGMQGAVEKAARLAKEIPGSFLPGQFENPANALAHYRSTGPEIWAQTGGQVDIFVAGVGTGGTITGTGRYLKEQNPSISIVAVEPANSPLLSQGHAGPHGIQGIGANFVPQVLDRRLLDQLIPVSQEAAFAEAQQLAAQGIPAGISAGANVHAAKLLAARYPEKTIVTILPDHADRYASLGL